MVGTLLLHSQGTQFNCPVTSSEYSGASWMALLINDEATEFLLNCPN